MGPFLLEGEKIFISGGDSDLGANIVHLVLARTPGAPKGTKGLSLFLVPKFWFGADLVPRRTKRRLRRGHRSRRWASTARPPARSRSATARPAAAGCSAKSSGASSTCSR
jgi:alkylation response protein AidB-like acyl-CoA dehydrogenase